ncbi:hypothetical protein SCLCIDRAFT_930388 [Scleroderma citrinum Foug A]|uniref:Uncharacterized protein n=1 Tax=Scleroderma citrinum Foug A TaxID=1036808 RepID=A0A0C3A7H1_9AGAM|nr:hypothetical protein SCLCIDRAFT_930388 [Scleroderma citrinum Foug A]
MTGHSVCVLYMVFWRGVPRENYPRGLFGVRESRSSSRVWIMTRDVRHFIHDFHLPNWGAHPKFNPLCQYANVVCIV